MIGLTAVFVGWQPYFHPNKTERQSESHDVLRGYIDTCHPAMKGLLPRASRMFPVSKSSQNITERPKGQQAKIITERSTNDPQHFDFEPPPSLSGSYAALALDRLRPSKPIAIPGVRARRAIAKWPPTLEPDRG